MRVRVNGLQPLIKTSIVEYRNGEEIEAELVYERLKKHCKICHRLDHDDKECPTTRASVPSRPSSAAQKRRNDLPSKRSDVVSRPPRRDDPSARPRLDYSSRRKEAYHTTGREHSHYSDRNLRGSSYHRRSPSPRHRSSYHHSSRGSPPRGRSPYDHRDSRSRYSSRSPQNRCRRDVSPNLVENSDCRREAGTSSRVEIQEEEVNSETRRRPNSTQVPDAALEVAMGELREVMVQYASCADPGESAARKERIRLAEAEGQFEETAEQMVRASLNLPSAENRKQTSPDLSSSHERIPAALRLGPLNAPPPLPPKPKKRSTAKRKPGRPPGRPTGASQGRDC
ncbi:serine/arginine repetitive matrix protein 1-like [Arabidopsis lyrata subsp. lyrata]|uniref:serine/arginine repetitive matrix protein 1-like n=1 Tax=Arabidopsis lyrata subsp. lyrata TaxID=81972 RepID=UPI000A29D362|nr:serine/arginine repetitive matrix protein 1-like [Arabidopsis lyrata subsp. lyrata]|eukprot:XP_020880718.1 serine/arginine repetitive matrix protein 1-like [Arabidopsis lyrata subsp. lyrata]